jgi:hypothetical protein
VAAVVALRPALWIVAAVAEVHRPWGAEVEKASAAETFPEAQVAVTGAAAPPPLGAGPMEAAVRDRAAHEALQACRRRPEAAAVAVAE